MPRIQNSRTCGSGYCLACARRGSGMWSNTSSSDAIRAPSIGFPECHSAPSSRHPWENRTALGSGYGGGSRLCPTGLRDTAVVFFTGFLFSSPNISHLLPLRRTAAEAAETDRRNPGILQHRAVELLVPGRGREPSSDESVQRFGGAEVGQWWLEVWNEPNMSPFWSGSFDQYL